MTLSLKLATLALVFAVSFETGRPAFAGANPPRVQIETNYGAVVIEVYPEKAPESAGDFLTYVDEDLYANAGIYRVVNFENDNGAPKINVIQGGVLGDGDPPRPFVAHETTEQTGLKHLNGAVSLARGPVGTGSAGYFFISIGDNPGLDFGGDRNSDGQGFAVFGQVVSGMDVVHRIHQLNDMAPSGDPYTQGQTLAEPVRFTTVKRISLVEMPASSE